MTRILEGVKAGDPVTVNSSQFGPGGKLQNVRHIERVTKVFKHVLQTEQMSGVEIATGRAPWTYGGKLVLPATDADVADVPSEIAERERADKAVKAKQEADAAKILRRGKLIDDIRTLMYSGVPDDVLERVLAVLRGER